jgi:hypothetical protein
MAKLLQVTFDIIRAHASRTTEILTKYKVSNPLIQGRWIVWDQKLVGNLGYFDF